MAEGLFNYLLMKQFPDEAHHYEVDSAGTSAYHIGELPDPRMRETAQKHGINLTSRARQIQAADLDTFDYVVAMDQSNYVDIKSLTTGEHKAEIVLMRHFEDSAETNVPDPYFGGQQGFEDVYQLLHMCNTNFLNHLIAR